MPVPSPLDASCILLHSVRIVAVSDDEMVVVGRQEWMAEHVGTLVTTPLCRLIRMIADAAGSLRRSFPIL